MVKKGIQALEDPLNREARAGTIPGGRSSSFFVLPNWVQVQALVNETSSLNGKEVADPMLNVDAAKSDCEETLVRT